MKTRTGILAIAGLMAILSCKKSNNVTVTNNTTTNSDTVPAIYKKIYGATSITRSGNNIIIKSNDLPDHKSVYYKGTQWQSTMYEAYNGTNTSFSAAPNVIAEQSFTFTIPMNPALNTAHSSTPLGPIGISLNG